MNHKETHISEDKQSSDKAFDAPRSLGIQPNPDSIVPESLEFMIDSSDALFIIIDHLDRIIFSNHAWNEFVLKNHSNAKNCLASDYLNAPCLLKQLDSLHRSKSSRTIRLNTSNPLGFMEHLYVKWSLFKDAEKNLIFATGAIEEASSNRHLLRKNDSPSNSSKTELGSWSYHGKSKDIFASKSLYEIFGLKKGEEKISLELFYQKLAPSNRINIQETINSIYKERKSSFTLECSIQPNNSDIRNLRITGDVEYDKKGNITHCIGTVEDLSSRDGFARQNSTADDVFSTVFNYSPLGFGYYLKNNKTFQFNTKFHELTGIPKLCSEENFYKKISAIIQDGSSLIPLIQEINQGKITSFTRNIHFKNKNSEGIQANIKVIRSEEHTGSHLQSIIILTDMTDHAETEKALRESEFVLRQIIDLVPHSIFAKDQEGRYILANKAMAERHNCQPENIIGKKDIDLNPNLKQANQFMLDDLAVIKSQETKFIPEETILSPQGEQRIVQTTKIPLTLGALKEKALMGICVDITNLKSNENTLISEKARAESNAEAKSAFLASMSHEIRTPLNSIIGLINLLEDTPLDPQQHYHVNNLKKSSELLLHLINDVLDLSKFEAGKLSFSNEVFDIKECINELLEMFIPKAKENGIRISFSTSQDNIPLVKAPKLRIRQVIINLISNALKYTDQGEIKIFLSYTKKSKNKAIFRFAVSDTGIGIPKDKIECIFDQFSQADHHASKDIQGTGLGLAICKRIVKALNGKISASSRLGKGSTFTFEMVLDTTDKETVPLSIVETTSSKELLNTFTIPENLKILLVEDDKLSQIVASQILKKLGGNCQVANNGEEALEILKKHNFDLVFMDVMMPKMSGLEATKHIRALKKPGKPPIIIAMTANAMSEDKEQCINAGMNDFISKPAKITDIQTIVNNYFPSAEPDAEE